MIGEVLLTFDTFELANPSFLGEVSPERLLFCEIQVLNYPLAFVDDNSTC
jgi:hypothetical protein